MGVAPVSSSVDIAEISNNTNPIWYKDAGIRKTVYFSCIIFVAQITAGFDEVTTGSFQAMSPWQADMQYPDASRLGLITSMLFVGGIAGSVVGPYIADTWGRRTVLATGGASCLTGSILQSASQNVGMFIFSRSLIGLGVVQTLVGGPSLVAELSHPRVRGSVLAFYNVLWYVGAILASWLTFGTGHLKTSWCWRAASVCQVIPSSILLIMLWQIPESPRFLIAKGRREEAHDILATYNANGDHNDALVLFEMREMDASVEIEAVHKKQSLKVLYSGPNARKRMFVVICVGIFVSFSGQNIITYYFVPILNSVGVRRTNQQTGINGGMQIWNLCCAIFGAVLVGRIGRRPVWIASFAGMILANIPLIATSAVYADSGSKPAAYVSIVTLFMYNAAFNIGCNSLPYSYTTEILPYNMRAKGLGIFNILCWSFSVITQYVNPIGLDNIKWKFYIVYLALDIIFLIIIYFTFPETQNRSLEDLDGGMGLEDISKIGSARNSMVVIDGVEKAGGVNISDAPSKFRDLVSVMERSEVFGNG